MLILRLLGPLEIRVGDRTLAAAGRDKGLTLLAYLAATAGRARTREDVADLFWPDMARERALQNLRQTLLRLRRLLAGDTRDAGLLMSDRHSVAFDARAEHWIDLTAFSDPGATPESLERLQQRAALYRGEFMADVAGDISERFEEWVTQQRAGCRAAALAMESTLVAAHERTGQLERAIAHARRCIGLEPWDEAGRQRLMRLLARAGHPEAALSEFGAWREALRRELGTDVQPETLALTEAIRSGALAPAAVVQASAPTERRQVTVLECGLSCGEDDPETMGVALAAPLRLAREILEQHGAHIADERPGRLTAYFGWPAANEHAATHAARSALALRSGVPAEHPDVTVAIGIDCGPMLVGEGDSGGWLAAERAMHLRLGALAGAVLVSETVAQSIGERFRLRAQRGAVRLIGEREEAPFDQPEAYPLTGRVQELALLTRHWREACTDGPRLLALTGQAGIGKSRLTREFLRANALCEPRVCWCECDPLHADSPLFALLRMLRGALELTAQAPPAEVQARLAAVLPEEHSAAVRLLVPLFCGKDSGTGAPQAGARAALVGAVAQLLARVLAASGAGSLLVLEDAHWADTTTIEVIEALGRSPLQGFPILLLARHLPRDMHAQEIALAPLEPPAAAELARLATGTQARDASAARSAEGVPLFIIELARMHTATGDGAGVVPATLRDLLAARLEQAGEDKALLQAAAVIGRTFDAAALRGLVSEPDGPIEGALERLGASKLIERVAHGARFSHALVQRAAYDSLPRARRIALHRRHAEQLQSGARGTSSGAPEEIAWHLSAGGLDGQAAAWWLRAAQRASRLPAYAEAAQFAERALTALEATPERKDHADTELAALLVGAYARVALGGYFDPAAQTLYGRARELLRDEHADPGKTFGVLRGYWLGASSRASHREARLIAEEMAAVAQAAGLQLLHGIAHYLTGNSALWLGEFPTALAHLEKAVGILRRTRAEPAGLLAHDQDFEATATGYLGWAHWHLGHTALALELGQRAMELARTRGHLLTLMHVSTSYCSIAMGSGAAHEVLKLAQQIIGLAETSGLAMWADIGRLQACWAQSTLGQPVDTGVVVQALARLCAVYPGGAAGFQVIAAQIHLEQGEYARAGTVLAALRRSIRATEAGMFTVARHLLESRLARQQGRAARAAAAARRAVKLARAQGAAPLEAEAWEAFCALRRAAQENASSSQSMETAAE